MKLMLLLVLAALPISAWAEPNDCVAGLLPNVTISSGSQRLNMAVMKVIDERTYRELQRGGSGGLSLPMQELPVPIKANLSYQEWDAQRHEYFERNSFDLSYDESFLLIRRVIPEVAYAAYSECLDRRADDPGIHIIVDDYTAKEAFITIRWMPPPNQSGSLGPTIVSVRASGTSDSMKQLAPITLGAGHKRQITFPFDPKEPLVISAETSDGFSDRKKLDVSSEKLNIPATSIIRTVTVKDLLLKALDEGRVCVARMIDHDGNVNPTPYVGGPVPRSTRINNLFEIRYDSSTERWLSHGRDYNSHPRLEINRGPSVAKQQINIFNVLFSLGEDGVLTAVSKGIGYPPETSGYLFCPITANDLR